MPARYVPVEYRIVFNIDILDNGCWHWLGGKFQINNYARMSVNNEGRAVHTVSYETFVGSIPEGMQLDHVCHSLDDTCPGGMNCAHRMCVNPDHLEAVTPQENVLRSQGHAAKNAVKTHCPRGHPLSGDNLYVTSGRRTCRICNKAKQVRYEEKRKAHV